MFMPNFIKIRKGQEYFWLICNGMTLILDQGSVVGHIEEADMVEESDEIWEEEKELQ